MLHGVGIGLVLGTLAARGGHFVALYHQIAIWHHIGGVTERGRKNFRGRRFRRGIRGHCEGYHGKRHAQGQKSGNDLSLHLKASFSICKLRCTCVSRGSPRRAVLVLIGLQRSKVLASAAHRAAWSVSRPSVTVSSPPKIYKIVYFIARAFTLAITSSISQYLGIFKGFSNNFFLYQNVRYPAKPRAFFAVFLFFPGPAVLP